MDSVARMISYTRDVYLRIFDSYNDAIWPAQVAGYVLCLLMLWWALRPGPASGRVATAALAALWLWTGFTFHILHFARIDFAGMALGALYLLQGLLLLLSGTILGRLRFRFADGPAGRFGIFLIAAAALYPLAAMAAGTGWRGAAYVGVAPAPTILLTFGMLLLTDRRTPWHLLALPVLLACIVGARGYVMELPQDVAVPAAALATLLVAVYRNGISRRSAV